LLSWFYLLQSDTKKEGNKMKSGSLLNAMSLSIPTQQILLVVCAKKEEGRSKEIAIKN
jgi:hypothetical protein